VRTSFSDRRRCRWVRSPLDVIGTPQGGFDGPVVLVAHDRMKNERERTGPLGAVEVVGDAALGCPDECIRLGGVRVARGGVTVAVTRSPLAIARPTPPEVTQVCSIARAAPRDATPTCRCRLHRQPSPEATERRSSNGPVRRNGFGRSTPKGMSDRLLRDYCTSVDRERRFEGEEAIRCRQKRTAWT
jgi:hypothetical protein